MAEVDAKWTKVIFFNAIFIVLSSMITSYFLY